MLSGAGGLAPSLPDTFRGERGQVKDEIVIARKRRNSITLENDLNGCINDIMDKVARTSQAVIRITFWYCQLGYWLDGKTHHVRYGEHENKHHCS
jgi:hypothetical protein